MYGHPGEVQVARHTGQPVQHLDLEQTVILRRVLVRISQIKENWREGEAISGTEGTGSFYVCMEPAQPTWASMEGIQNILCLLLLDELCMLSILL